MKNNKKKIVKEVFDSVFERYDIMNDLMSFGIHRIWKKTAINNCNIKNNDIILDLACGTGDLTKIMIETRKNIQIVLADINKNMLSFCKKRLYNLGYIKNLNFVQANAENLPFKKNTFNKVIIGFGLRNFNNIEKSIKCINKILKKNGKLIILEFSQPTNKIIKILYDMYSYNIIPNMGKIICNDYVSYKYLVDSIKIHPNQIELNNLIKKNGFKYSNFKNLSNGIVSIHTAIK